ncbi:MAG: DUF4232 domain-containing protein [Chloroflexi bacterium]|nr:DUF4232 domain-containing protein [Chloroflexota bacterium]
MRLRFLIAFLLAAGFVNLMPASTARAQNCQFVLGFATMDSLIPQQVGQCLENEHHNPINGDALQMTTGGLLVWRKFDNWTAFTDGFRTWINGPFGLQMRLNSQRFSWEFNPDNLAITPPPMAGDRCHTGGLSVSAGEVDAGAGNFHQTFRLTNRLSVPCTFFGYVGAQMLDAGGNALPTNVVRNGSQVTQATPTLVTVPPGGSAVFDMHWEDVIVGNETSCATSSALKITPPDEFDSLLVSPFQAMACNHGELDVSAIRAG